MDCKAQAREPELEARGERELARLLINGQAEVGLVSQRIAGAFGLRFLPLSWSTSILSCRKERSFAFCGNNLSVTYHHLAAMQWLILSLVAHSQSNAPTSNGMGLISR